MKRRTSLKAGTLLAVLFSTCRFEEWRRSFEEFTSPNQRIVINLPAYTLSLEEVLNGKVISSKKYKIGIGMGSFGKPETPTGNGYVFEKIRQPRFYNDDGTEITETLTFDNRGRSLRYPLPDTMRSLKMRLYTGFGVYDRFVIHATNQEFSIATPCSNGCIRMPIDKMLDLYASIAPEVDDGPTAETPLIINYNVVEVDRGKVRFHADVYETDYFTPEDYIAELERVLKKNGYDTSMLNYGKIEKLLNYHLPKFTNAYAEITERLTNPWPDNFVSEGLKEKLHFTCSINNILTYRNY